MMMKLVMGFYEEAMDALNKGANINDLIKMPVREAIGRLNIHTKIILSEFDRINNQLSLEIANALSKEED